MGIRRLVRKLFRQYGIDIHKFQPDSSPEAHMALIFRTLSPDLVMDVGANIGQYGQLLRRCEYNGRIVSFEPLTKAYEELVQNAKHDNLWEIGPRVALGGEDSDTTLNISGNSVSSSLLPMLPAHVSATPESVYVGTEPVSVRRLDVVAMPYLKGESNILLKIDAQGYEEKILEGATALLSRVTAIQLELSLVPLYEGENLFFQMLQTLGQKGFELFVLMGGHMHPVTGQTLQADVFVTRKKLMD